MTEMVSNWTKEELCREFWASMDEFYGRWKESSGGRLPDFEAAMLRGKTEGLEPHPAFAPSPVHKVGEEIRKGDVHEPPEKDKP